ncbi:hypothetical protein EPN81_03850 [Patescibacteria group bacterium]|nr:MAG: hypothetical protein EPN81_03850 [Patescibacteria group bacterium]
MAVEVLVEPSPLPFMKRGETQRIRIQFIGGIPQEEMLIRILGATSTENAFRIHMARRLFRAEPSIDLTIRAIQDGTPTIIVSSPKRRFNTVTVNGHPTPLQADKDQIVVPTPSPKKEHTKESLVPDEPSLYPKNHAPPNQPRSWRPALKGALAWLIMVVGAVIAWQWHESDDQIETEATPATPALPEPNVATSPLPPVPAVTTPPTKPKPAAVAPPSPKPAQAPALVPATRSVSTPTPPAPAPAPKAKPAPVAPATDPTKCRFVSGSRPMKDGKYFLTCAEGKYLARGTYVLGHFEWSEFEEQAAP